MCVGGWNSWAVGTPTGARFRGPPRCPLTPGEEGGRLGVLRLDGPPQRRQSSLSPPGLRSRLLSGAEVGGHGGWGKGGAVDGDVGDAAGEEIAAALQHPGP